MPYHYVWLIWSSAFLLPWIVLYGALPAHRKLAVVPARPEGQHAGRRNIVPRALHGVPAGSQVVGTGLHRTGLEPRGAERRAHLRLAAGGTAVRVFVWSRLDGDI